MTHEQAMRRALELAWKGWGQVAPNPMVGAVLLRNGELAGEGYHGRYGGPHAEVEALRRCDDPTGTTCVVTLEPCNHRGKTPPCVEALIGAAVSRVVVALRDPSPVAGGGIERLRASGIAVEVGVLRENAAVQNAPFLWSTVRPARPFVALKVATSIDGFISDASGRSKWISGSRARDWVQWLRGGYDALAVGRRTAVHDDPHLTVRGGVAPRVAPQRIVFARTADIPDQLFVLRSPDEAPTILVVDPDAEAAASRRFAASAGVSVIAASEPEAALRALREVGVGSVLLEGGGAIAAAFLERGLVDRLYWIQAPVWLGRGTPAFGERSPINLEGAVRWRVSGRESLGEDSLTVLDRELCLQA